MMAYFYLLIAILGDIVATSALKASGGFTKLVPSIWVMCGYGVVLLTLCLSLKALPLGVTYAVWSGVGMVGVTIVSALYFHEPYDAPRIVGTLLVALGVVIMYAFPRT